MKRRFGPGRTAWVGLVAAGALAVGLAALLARSSFPAIEAIDVPESTSRNLARTMGLLRSSTADAPNTVRILVYGQSITAQDWWKAVHRYLESSFPLAVIEMENRAIGGFSTPRLVQTVEQDVVPFYPDLVLFHDYGNHVDYEQIIRVIRSRTITEIGILNDHIGPTQNQFFHNEHSFNWLPALCEQYDLACIDVRSGWQNHIHDHKLLSRDLLRDNIHLNDHGNYLMAGIVQQYLVSIPDLPPDPHRTVRQFRRGTDFEVEDGKLKLAFSGNRVDLVFDPRASAGQVLEAQLDGVPISSDSGCWTITRPGEDLLGHWPPPVGTPKNVELASDFQSEMWTMNVSGVSNRASHIEFDLHGDRTGYDGAGTSDSLFMSTSGRIVIRPEHWFKRQHDGDFPDYHEIAEGDSIRWSVFSMCQDSVSVSIGSPVTIARGIRNGAHQLVLSSDNGRIPVSEIRVYRPPLRADPPTP